MSTAAHEKCSDQCHRTGVTSTQEDAVGGGEGVQGYGLDRLDIGALKWRKWSMPDSDSSHVRTCVRLGITGGTVTAAG